jgi:S1-C subfamily serine protease
MRLLFTSLLFLFSSFLLCQDISDSRYRSFFDNREFTGIEGIWQFSSNSEAYYKFYIIKNAHSYDARIIETNQSGREGESKATLEPAAADGILTIKWKSISEDERTLNTIGSVSNNSLIEFNLNGQPAILYRVYPKLDQINSSNEPDNDGNWYGNGSGLIISSSGYIVTNNHVIDGADKIEVEFLLNEEVQKFNAEIVMADKVNDLAIIKIFDVNFDGIGELKYNFKMSSSDVGTKVYAYGYPMALTIMGKEIKVTDGIISSKSGYEGDITTYQISASIQGGNSGGPLFDEKGNFLGINSSGLKKEIADNVGYSIKSSYVFSLIDVLPKSIDLPNSMSMASLPLTEQIKEISKYVVLVKVK